MNREPRQGGRRRRPTLERRYGYFACPSCRSHWESAHVYCVRDTNRVYFKQECKKCSTACNPYRVEYLECPKCGLPVPECKEVGECYSDDSDDEQHVDPEKQHRADLCLKCRSGWKCGQRRA